MSVSAILEGKPKKIVTASPSDSVASVVQILAKHRIGAVIISDKNDKVEGILSERDIVRDIAREGSDVLEKDVSQCMTSKVLNCGPDDSIDTVMKIMTDNHFRHMPVCVDGKLIGVISIGDVVKRTIENAVRDAEDMRNYIAS